MARPFKIIPASTIDDIPDVEPLREDEYQLTVKLPLKLEEAFKICVFERMGMRRGNMATAIKEAMTMWIDCNDYKRGGK
jgi:hypothetical protein